MQYLQYPSNRPNPCNSSPKCWAPHQQHFSVWIVGRQQYVWMNFSHVSPVCCLSCSAIPLPFVSSLILSGGSNRPGNFLNWSAQSLNYYQPFLADFKRQSAFDLFFNISHTSTHTHTTKKFYTSTTHGEEKEPSYRQTEKHWLCNAGRWWRRKWRDSPTGGRLWNPSKSRNQIYLF